MDRYNPRDYYGLFPDNLCKHGFNKLTCYPCAPLPTEDPNLPKEFRDKKPTVSYRRPLWERRDSREDY